MPERLPSACTYLPRQKQDDLVNFTQGVCNGLLAAIAIFPTPPVLPADLQILLNTYIAALTAAELLGVNETAEKDNAKFNLENALRVDAAYVNQLVYNLVAGGSSYAAMRADITLTGYFLSQDPVAPGIPLPQPENFRSKSIKKGVIQAYVNSVPRNRGLLFQYRVKATPDNPWLSIAWPNLRPVLNDLNSGSTYQLQCSFIGSSPVQNFSVIIEQVCI